MRIDFSVQFSPSVVSDSLRPCGLQHTRLPCPSSQWCHTTISSSVPFSSCLQSFPASGSFLMSRLFASSGQSVGASVSASLLPMNIQDWFPLGLTGWISLLSKGLSRIFSSTTVQNSSILHCSAFFIVQLSHPYVTPGKNHSFDYIDLCQQSNVSAF